MSIKILHPNTNPMFHTSYADKDIVSYVKGVLEPPEICECVIGKCEYINSVFANPFQPTNNYENDFTVFLLKLRSVDVLDEEIEIFKNGISQGMISPLKVYDAKNKHIGFDVKWLDIYNLFGVGEYYFILKYLQIGIIVKTFTTMDYYLQLFDYIDAKDTVKINWIQDGNIEDSYNLLNKNQKFEIRINAKVKLGVPILEKIGYENSLRRYTQIQDKVYNVYELVTKLIPKEVGDVLTKEMVLANDIKISSYNLKTYKPLYFTELTCEEISNFIGNYDNNKNGSFTIKFSDRVKNTLKRNNRV